MNSRMVPLTCEDCKGSGWVKSKPNQRGMFRRCKQCAGMGVFMVVTEIPDELTVEGGNNE